MKVLMVEASVPVLPRSMGPLNSTSTFERHIRSSNSIVDVVSNYFRTGLLHAIMQTAASVPFDSC